MSRFVDPSQFEFMCRLCMINEKTLKCIFETKYEKRSMAELIHSWLSIDIKDEDSLPKRICAQCIAELIRFQIFKDRCLQVQSRLIKSVKKYSEVLLKIQSHDEVETKDNKGDVHLHSVVEVTNVEKETQVHEDELPSDFEESLVTMEGYDEEIIFKSDAEPYVINNIDVLDQNISLVSENDFNRDEGVTNKSEEKKIACQYCGKLYCQGSIRIHMRSHTKEKPYHCHKCPIACVTSGSLKRHLKTHDGDQRPHKCDVCAKGFNDAHHLELHKNIHVSELPIICPVCSKVFDKAKLYTHHIKIHVRDNNKTEIFVCDKCNKSFKTKNTLKRHQDTHNDKLFTCDECNKGFNNSGALRVHMRIHTGERSYTCHQCGKGYTSKCSLKHHLLRHSDQRPFVCNMCPKTFTQFSQMKYHMRTHTGETPYVCPYCNKGYTLKSTLNVHIKVHTGEMSKCNVCDMYFHDPHSLSRHRRLQHNIVFNRKVD